MRHRSTVLRSSLWPAISLLIALPVVAGAESGGETADPDLWALELGVPDVERAVSFYTEALGFEAIEGVAGSWTLLGNGEARLALSRSDLPIAPKDGARAYANFSVGDVGAASRRVIAAGGSAEEAFDSPVGRAIRFFDPFGHPGHLIDHPWDEMADDATPAVFNVALTVRDVESSERFYATLGFEVSTRDYLPQTLVFKPRGSAQLILHPSAEGDAVAGREAGALLLDADPARALAALEGHPGGAPDGYRLARVERATTTAIEVRDPSGILVELARREPAMKPLSAEQARAAFERLKGLAGRWQAKSTKGWNEPVTYELAAGGSVVVESNSFKDAPDRTMYTMFHLDGDRLLATHYCASGNQPRLIASGVSDDGSQLTFTYLDATGLPSRDHGHMDQAVFRFLAPDHFTSRWTWYQKGAESWLEEIEHRRTDAVARAAVSP